ncbi:MAG TPA: thiosulfate oxidation carrier complex protein SoxZ [Gemmatimonadaceae bacterium]|nr:thiosulfate oxidation carrier complex protein SoxZ [Gemmatimonadaceae bacterium]
MTPTNRPAIELAPPQTGTGDAKVLVPARVQRNAVLHVRALLAHPMLTGLSRDAEGKPIPAYWVKEVRVTYGGDPVARFEWSSGISRDPYVAFPLKAAREAPLTVTWTDNRGAVFTQTADIRFG